MFEINGKFTKAKVMIDDVEETCVSQITKMINHPAFVNPVAIMPDTHAGKGSVIGFTMPLGEKIIPNVVGVDISCGVLCVKIGKELKYSLETLDNKIRQRVPFGFKVYDRSIINMRKKFPWKSVNKLAHNFTLAYNKKFNTSFNPPIYDYNYFEKTCKKTGASPSRVLKSIGTLGGG